MQRPALSCPSWARTRTLLIQSQACCQLHQGAVLSIVRAPEANRNLPPLPNRLKFSRIPSATH